MFLIQSEILQHKILHNLAFWEQCNRRFAIVALLNALALACHFL